MIVSCLRFLQCTHKPPPYPILTFSYTTRSLLPHKDEPINWNTTHSFILSNPLLSLLEKCKSTTQVKQIQTQMIITGLILDGLAASRLVAFCALSESKNLDYCKRILNNLRSPNVFSWNVMIRGYCTSEKPEESLLLYMEILRRGNVLRPDNHTYPLLLKCCAKLSLIRMGFSVIGHVIHLGFQSDMYVNNAVIHLLVSCGELYEAHKVFNESCVRDLVSWNSIINGYVRNGKPSEALKLYEQMEEKGITPDEVTMIGMISSCAQLENLNLGRKLHQCIEENRIKMTVPLANALMDMYVKCGNIGVAKSLFHKMTRKTIVSWTTMIVGYGKNGHIDVAKKLFMEMPEKNVVSCNAMIGVYIQAKYFEDALATFHEMQGMKIQPDEVTMLYCLSACSQLGALDVGIWVHQYITKHNMSINVALGTALVDMYAKCGNIGKAFEVFNEIPNRNSLTWTAIINGLANHGLAHDAISHFWEMINIGLTPDEITFLGVLSACCHGGLVNEGRKIFSQMTSVFNIVPKSKHYSCMVDLLGRAGLLKEAEELIKTMPIKADEIVWGALFFACRIHGDVEMGERAAFKLLELDPTDSGTYVLLAGMYREAKMFEKSMEVRKLMRVRGVGKTPGCSAIEVNGNVFQFIIRDKSHPQHQEISELLVQLTKQLVCFQDIDIQFLLLSSF
uniref:pentatricopeptide repeat-containing protein At2g22410, mitochondrial n=1 Tax=Erigeron canadensis TaxID=72917 RepID=UPI001CB9B6C5|nr:pentatricopeptide repeat-containing protein At2g22410, mitochondrial [Erigeron canadensis]